MILSLSNLALHFGQVRGNARLQPITTRPKRARVAKLKPKAGDVFSVFTSVSVRAIMPIATQRPPNNRSVRLTADSGFFTKQMPP